MMLLLEHNGKALLRSYGVPTLTGTVVSDRGTLASLVKSLPRHLVLKAQIPVGGRGKSGGILFTSSEAEALAAFDALHGRMIEGHRVTSVLVEERAAYERERYIAVVIAGGEMRLLLARRGGVDIEDITAADPANLLTLAIDPIDGPGADQLRAGFDRLGYDGAYRAAYEEIARKLFAMSRALDAAMIEINPLVELPGGALLALDARVSIDDAARGRQPLIAATEPQAAVTARGAGGSPDIRFKENPAGGTIGLIGLGSGLNVALMDWIAAAGATVASLVDVDEAITAGRAEEGFLTALDIFDRNPALRSILINIITCGYRLDDIVRSLMRAFARRVGGKPVILHLRGNSMAETPQLLAAAGWRNSPSIAAAVRAVVDAAKA
jgi:succinyl-CoA synthetase beta subunit